MMAKISETIILYYLCGIVKTLGQKFKLNPNYWTLKPKNKITYNGSKLT